MTQAERDAVYPQEYDTNCGITKEQWENMLTQQNIFTVGDLEIIRLIYECDNHAATCKELEVLRGIYEGECFSINAKMISLGRRISNAMSDKMRHLKNSTGGARLWGVLFWGRFLTKEEKKNGRLGIFEWKLKPELAAAMESVLPNLQSLENDGQLQTILLPIIFPIENLKKQAEKIKWESKPKDRPDLVKTGSPKAEYPRNAAIARDALIKSEFRCEYNESHTTFIRRGSNVPYMEAHHLIPLSEQDKFDYSLDIRANVVCLCPNCHRRVHYGNQHEIQPLLVELLQKRHKALHRAGIDISLEQLETMY